MKKKLFIRDLEKRKSASQLFVNPVSGSSHDASMHRGGRSYNKPGYGQHYGIAKKYAAPDPGPIAKKYAAPYPGPIAKKYAAPDPTPTIDPKLTVDHMMYGVPEPMDTTAALGEEGNPAK